jgi:hypothetical protein
MALILRVDVDKPYGHSNLFYKLISKISEDFWFPTLSFIYLFHLENFLQYCNANEVKGIFYHRMCTLPSKKIKKLILEGKHKIGFHAENTRNLDTFSGELNLFKAKLNDLECISFSKHGSGVYKLGRFHYPPYEEEKYLDWSKYLHIKFPFGNGIAEKNEDFDSVNDFFDKMFWIEPEYRSKKLNKIEDIIEIAKHKDVPVLIHPCNFYSHKMVRDEFVKLVELAKQNKIEWVLV